MDNCYNCYEHRRYGCKCANMDEKRPCWRPDYEILSKAFRLAVMGVLQMSKFIYDDEDVAKAMERYLEQAVNE